MSETQAMPVHDDALDRWLGWMCSLPLGLIVVLTFFDVFARYVFSAPIKGSLEIIQYSMALSIFAALPLVATSGPCDGVFDRWPVGGIGPALENPGL